MKGSHQPASTTWNYKYRRMGSVRGTPHDSRYTIVGVEEEESRLVGSKWPNQGPPPREPDAKRASPPAEYATIQPPGGLGTLGDLPVPPSMLIPPPIPPTIFPASINAGLLGASDRVRPFSEQLSPEEPPSPYDDMVPVGTNSPVMVGLGFDTGESTAPTEEVASPALKLQDNSESVTMSSDHTSVVSDTRKRRAASPPSPERPAKRVSPTSEMSSDATLVEPSTLTPERSPASLPPSITPIAQDDGLASPLQDLEVFGPLRMARTKPAPVKRTKPAPFAGMQSRVLTDSDGDSESTVVPPSSTRMGISPGRSRSSQDSDGPSESPGKDQLPRDRFNKLGDQIFRRILDLPGNLAERVTHDLLLMSSKEIALLLDSPQYFTDKVKELASLHDVPSEEPGELAMEDVPAPISGQFHLPSAAALTSVPGPVLSAPALAEAALSPLTLPPQILTAPLISSPTPSPNLSAMQDSPPPPYRPTVSPPAPPPYPVLSPPPTSMVDLTQLPPPPPYGGDDPLLPLPLIVLPPIVGGQRPPPYVGDDPLLPLPHVVIPPVESREAARFAAKMDALLSVQRGGACVPGSAWVSLTSVVVIIAIALSKVSLPSASVINDNGKNKGEAVDKERETESVHISVSPVPASPPVGVPSSANTDGIAVPQRRPVAAPPRRPTWRSLPPWLSPTAYSDVQTHRPGPKWPWLSAAAYSDVQWLRPRKKRALPPPLPSPPPPPPSGFQTGVTLAPDRTTPYITNQFDQVILDSMMARRRNRRIGSLGLVIQPNKDHALLREVRRAVKSRRKAEIASMVGNTPWLLGKARALPMYEDRGLLGRERFTLQQVEGDEVWRRINKKMPGFALHWERRRAWLDRMLRESTEGDDTWREGYVLHPGWRPSRWTDYWESTDGRQFSEDGGLWDPTNRTKWVTPEVAAAVPKDMHPYSSEEDDEDDGDPVADPVASFTDKRPTHPAAANPSAFAKVPLNTTTSDSGSVSLPTKVAVCTTLAAVSAEIQLDLVVDKDAQVPLLPSWSEDSSPIDALAVMLRGAAARNEDLIQLGGGLCHMI